MSQNIKVPMMDTINLLFKKPTPVIVADEDTDIPVEFIPVATFVKNTHYRTLQRVYLILKYIKGRKGGTTYARIADKVGLSKSRVGAISELLVQLNVIKIEKESNGNKVYNIVYPIKNVAYIELLKRVTKVYKDTISL